MSNKNNKNLSSLSFWDHASHWANILAIPAFFIAATYYSHFLMIVGGPILYKLFHSLYHEINGYKEKEANLENIRNGEKYKTEKEKLENEKLYHSTCWKTILSGVIFASSDIVGLLNSKGKDIKGINISPSTTEDKIRLQYSQVSSEDVEEIMQEVKKIRMVDTMAHVGIFSSILPLLYYGISHLFSGVKREYDYLCKLFVSGDEENSESVSDSCEYLQSDLIGEDNIYNIETIEVSPV